MPFQSTLYFDSVCVVESLRPGDRRTGEWLHDNVLELFSFQHSGFSTLFHSPKSKPEFLAAISDVRTQFAEAGRAPVLHLEAHGARRGIQVSSGEWIAWEELKEVLTEINIRCGLNLLVVSAMCQGGFLAEVIRPTERAPVWAVIGPTKNVFDVDLQAAMEAFYRELLTSFDGRAALDALNSCAAVSEWEYRFLNAEILFCRAFQHYVNAHGTGEALRGRENDLVARLVWEQNLDLLQSARLRSEIQQKLVAHGEWFERFRDRFFMLDLYPHNRQRFQLTYDECVQRGTSAA